MYGEIERTELRQLLKKASSDTTRNVIKKEFLWSPYIFYHTAKHPKGEHIKKYVLEIGMHEHVGYELINLEVGSKKKMKSKDIIKIYRHSAR